MKHLALLLALLLPVPLAQAQNLAIDHRPVGCIVAGKYPRLNACFAPISLLARARLYFRAGEAGSDWYYVEMKSDAPCHAGVLPRPKRELVGQNVEYYLEASDRGFASSRTEEYRARVVEKASECDAKLPIPALLDKASVAVFPALPAGFAGGGIGLGATAAVVGGGAALAGGAVAVATKEGGGSTAVSSTPPPTSPVATFPPTTTTTTTSTLPGFTPVFKVFKGSVAVDPNAKIIGADPLVLTFDMCDSVGPYKLSYAVEVDGAGLTAGCRSTVTFTASGAKASGAGSPRAAVTSARTFDVRMRMQSAAVNNDPQASKNVLVEVTGGSPTSGCSVDTQGPQVTLKSPAAGAVYPASTPYPVHFEALADDTKTGNNGISVVEYKVDYPGPTQAVLGPGSSSSPYGFDWTQADVEAWLGIQCKRIATVQAYAVDNCGNATFSPSVQITVGTTLTSCVPFAPTRDRAALLSDLAVPGGRGQLVVDGTAVFVRDGRSPVTVRGAARQVRVEATLVDARAAGSWRFDLSPTAGVLPDSVQVIAGDVVQAAGGALVFRVQGRPGERIVFSFTTK